MAPSGDERPLLGPTLRSHEAMMDGGFVFGACLVIRVATHNECWKMWSQGWKGV